MILLDCLHKVLTHVIQLIIFATKFSIIIAISFNCFCLSLFSMCLKQRWTENRHLSLKVKKRWQFLKWTYEKFLHFKENRLKMGKIIFRRSILREVCELTDTTQGRYAQLQAEIASSVTAISPKSEYTSFSESNK